MEEEQHVEQEKSETGWFDLPQELREIIIERCELQNLAKMAICAPNLRRWLPAKYVESVFLYDRFLDGKVFMRFILRNLKEWKNDITIEGEFENLENGTATQVEWSIDSLDRSSPKITSNTKFMIEKNYKNQALLEFQRFLNFSQNHVKNIAVYWDNFDHRTIDPKMFKKLESITMYSGEKIEEQEIGYDLEDVLKWTNLRNIQIDTNHWKNEDFRRIITNWLQQTGTEKVFSKMFKMSNERFNKLDKSEMFDGLNYREIDNNGKAEYHFAHPIFSDYCLSIDFYFRCPTFMSGKCSRCI